MRVKNFPKRLRESVLPLVIVSIAFTFIILSGMLPQGMLLAALCGTAMLFYAVWWVATLIRSFKGVNHRKTYYVTNGIILLLIAVPSIILSFFAKDPEAFPYYYFFFCPFAAFKFTSFVDIIWSNAVSVAVLFVSYIAVPLSVKRKRRKHRHHTSGPVDTNSFIMRG